MKLLSIKIKWSFKLIAEAISFLDMDPASILRIITNSTWIGEYEEHFNLLNL